MSLKFRLIFLSFILIPNLFLLGCSSDNIVNNITEVDSTSVSDVKNQQLSSKKLTSIQTSYLENDFFSYDTVVEYENNEDVVFQNSYSDLDGIFTFRGNSLRNSPSFGVADIDKSELEVSWEFKTSSSSWGGGAGWTGQPAIIKWPKELKENMNIKSEFKNKDDLTEVIYASLDGNIYFLDLKTGCETRDKIKVGNPIKGSVSIDPRGLPLLYVGEGINEKGIVGFNIYSLIDGSLLYELNGSDPNANRSWPAFDSSAVINKATDSVIVGGENGLVYSIKLNSNYDKSNNTINIDPKINRYKYSSSNNRGRLGIENSIATYSNLAYFADNGGVIQCIDLNNLKPVWSVDGFDDIDATLTIDIENEIPYVYCGNEVDHQGSKGVVKLKKLNGLNGEIVWEKEFNCQSLVGKKPVNGGLMSTNIIGKNNINNLAIFSLARYGGFNNGSVIALDKETGNIMWDVSLDNYMWSSPVDIYDEDGNGYILQGDSAGNLHLIDGASGKILNSITLNGNIESSPAVFNNTLVVATRNGTIYGINIK